MTSALITVVTDHLWQASAVAAALWLFLRVDWQPARVRHDAALAAFLAACLLPLCSFLPALGPAAPAGGAGGADVAAAASAQGASAAVVGVWLARIWAAGTFVMLLRLGRDLVSMMRISGSAQSVTLPQDIARALADVPIRSSAAVRAPVTAGVLRPVVLLPPSFADRVSARDLRMVLEHERAHVRRHDVRLAVLQSLLLAAFWWSPALYWMAGRMRDERELACDEAAVARTGDGLGLARMLVRQAEAMGSSRAPPGAMMAALGRPSLTARRVRNLTRSPAARGPIAVLSGSLLLVGLTATAIVSAYAAPRISFGLSAPRAYAVAEPRPALDLPSQAQTAAVPETHVRARRRGSASIVRRPAEPWADEAAADAIPPGPREAAIAAREGALARRAEAMARREALVSSTSPT